MKTILTLIAIALSLSSDAQTFVYKLTEGQKDSIENLQPWPSTIYSMLYDCHGNWVVPEEQIAATDSSFIIANGYTWIWNTPLIAYCAWVVSANGFYSGFELYASGDGVSDSVVIRTAITPQLAQVEATSEDACCFKYWTISKDYNTGFSDITIYYDVAPKAGFYNLSYSVMLEQ